MFLRHQRIAFGLCLALMSGPALAAKPRPVPASSIVYIGTHGSAIFSARLNTRTGKLSPLGQAAEIERPTWLVVDPRRPVLYSVSETGNDGKTQGEVYSFSVEPLSGRLTTLSKVESGGGGATHLAYDQRSSTVFVANFGGGQVSAIPVQSDGALQPVSAIQTDVGSGPHPRQASAHAHGVTIDPSGRYVLSPDLGADRVFVYRFTAASRQLAPADVASEATPAGSGPRHLVFSPNGRFAYLATELNGEIRTYRWDARAGRLNLVQALPIDGPDFKGERSVAEVMVSKDGRFVYVSNRGENQLQVYAVNRATGALTERQAIGGGVDIPWSFGIDPSGRWMVVANENSSTVTTFRIDKANGRLRALDQTLTVPKPVAIAFYPQ